MLSKILNLSVVALGLAGVVSAGNLLDIRDWQNKAVDLGFGLNINYNVVYSYPPNGGGNQKWNQTFLNGGNTTFTLASSSNPTYKLVYSTFAVPTPSQVSLHSQAIIHSTAFATLRLDTVRTGIFNIIDVVTGLALTSWGNSDPATWKDTGTPLTWELISNPKSQLQSFNITVIGPA